MDSPLLITICTKLLAGLGVGFLVGLTGIGGGVVLMPLLTLALGIPAGIAVGTANVFSFGAKAYASYEHFKLRTIDGAACKSILFGALPATIAASLVVVIFTRDADLASLARFHYRLHQCIAAMIALSAILLAYSWITKCRDTTDSASVFLKQRTTLGVVLGAAIGTLIGVTSIGGGVLVLPVLRMVFRLNGRAMVGSSIVIAVLLALTSSMVYALGGAIDWSAALLLWVGSLPGVYAGARLSTHIPDRLLQAGIILLTATSALLMFIG